ncbi:MAG: hypothetical protein K1X89_19520 [Myxococcaceae bacterium]|nr:hypothetical protein [Myxococcaceae bacterium]
MLRAASLLLFASTACGGLLAPVCTTSEPLLRDDAGVFTCVRAEDCPRPTNVLICTSTEDQARDCVLCSETRCLRFTRGACP